MAKREKNHVIIGTKEKLLRQLENDNFSSIKAKFQEAEKLSYLSPALEFFKNTKKNRYNIKCYDYNKVELPSGNYVNASYVESDKDGIGCSRFIAAMGPVKASCEDFWELIESHKVSSIVMLCKNIENKKLKCYYYFNTVGAKKFGKYEVIMMSQNELISKKNGQKEILVESDLVIKNLQTKAEFFVKHYNLASWPDHSVPQNYELLLYLYDRVVRPAENDHLVVHCSAGIGRTGCYIGAWMCFELYLKGQLISMEKALQLIRQQRHQAVQTLDQYCLLQLLFIELILLYDPEVDKRRFLRLKQKYITIVKDAVEDAECDKDTAAKPQKTATKTVAFQKNKASTKPKQKAATKTFQSPKPKTG